MSLTTEPAAWQPLHQVAVKCSITTVRSALITLLAAKDTAANITTTRATEDIIEAPPP